MNFKEITSIFKTAESDGRDSLYEYEIYELLKTQEIFTLPETILIKKDCEYSDKELTAIPGDRVILKIVSSRISHKTDVGGVKIVKKSAGIIREAVRQMIEDVPKKYALMVENGTLQAEDSYRDLSSDAMKDAVYEDIKGVLQVQYISSDLNGFGSELLAGIRNTREFGPIISAGTGGTDTELFAEIFRKGQSVVTASVAIATGEEFLNTFKQTVSYKKLAGLARGQKPVSVDDRLLKCFSFFISLVNFYSLSDPDTPYVIKEFEVNPFVLHDSFLVPLDGLCKFGPRRTVKEKRPWHKIDNLLHPESIGIIGVSTTRMNFGRIMLNNILTEGYEKKHIRIIRPGMESFKGVTCVPDLKNLDIKLDLLVVAVGADQVLPVVDAVTTGQICESVMLIPGGLGETEKSKEIAELINDRISMGHLREDGGPVFLGANCLGVISHPGKYDTLFIPEEKLPKQRGTHKRNIAFLSQSGAFMITRVSKMPELNPAYMISMGNQNDLTLGDMLSYLKDRDDIDVIAVYAEGFKDLDGLSFIRALKEAVNNGKDVIVYKAGRTPEGKNATGSHTASIAGDYRVFESCVKQAGGIVASGFTQFEDLLMVAKQLNKKRIRGNRIAALSGAGFEAVGMADNIDADGFNVKLAPLKNKTVKRLESLLSQKGLTHLTEVKNPLDLNPASDDEAHILAVKYLAEDENVDIVVAGLDPLSPATRTLFQSKDGQYDFNKPGSMVADLPKLVKLLKKPVIGVVDGGRLFEPMADELKRKDMIIFRSADRALKVLGVYIEARLKRNKIAPQKGE
ncbi:MAG: acetate--CoA ligase family protein [Desulfobacteraceae bacterium]|jgi:acyl-CoA synthetase (NDP forming)